MGQGNENQYQNTQQPKNAPGQQSGGQQSGQSGQDKSREQREQEERNKRTQQDQQR